MILHNMNLEIIIPVDCTNSVPSSSRRLRPASLGEHFASVGAVPSFILQVNLKLVVS